MIEKLKGRGFRVLIFRHLSCRGQVRDGLDQQRLHKAHEAEDPQRGTERLWELSMCGQEFVGRDGRSHKTGR